MRKGSHHTEKSKRKQHDANAGEKHPMYGTHETAETKEKQRVAKIGKKNPMYGTHHTEEKKEKKRKEMMGNTFRLRTHDTKETKEKKRKGMKGKHDGEKNPFYGKRHTEKTKKEYRVTRAGKNNPNYIDGKSNDPYPLEFNDTLKELIRYRDGYRCQLCGIPQSEHFQRLDVHHIDHNPKNNDPKNLITLCRSCNCKVNSHANRDKWQKYFEKKVIEIIRKEKTK